MRENQQEGKMKRVKTERSVRGLDGSNCHILAQTHQMKTQCEKLVYLTYKVYMEIILVRIES